MEKYIDDARKDITKFMLSYKFALEEISTKISILQEKFRLMHDYNPIEHVNHRLKSPKSILKKVEKKGIEKSLNTIEQTIRDIAGVRLVCAFEEDIYRVAEMLCKQRDIEVIDIKDYIQTPKENGYRSLHIIVKIPVFLSDEMRQVYVELQLRTIAMDFWASLEHKIYYKYNKAVPAHIQAGLKEAADQATALDNKMAHLNEEINILKQQDDEEEENIADYARYIREFVQFNMQI